MMDFQEYIRSQSSLSLLPGQSFDVPENIRSERLYFLALTSSMGIMRYIIEGNIV